ncbi:MAG: aspartate aminotransferase family protein [Gammaproteobacteria bacterium]
MNVQETEQQLGIGFCKRQPLVAERGEGALVWDAAGKKYLDFTSGWGVTCLGHAHPVMRNALSEQAAKLWQNPNSGFAYSPVRAQLLEELQNWLPAPAMRTFFVNSGAEANDAAIKLARKITGRCGIVSTSGGFHGRTFNTLTVSVNQSSAEGFLPLLPHNQFVRFGDPGELEAALGADTAALIVEPIQGEGGVQIPAADYLAQARALCKANSTLLIIDEIQTGFCRTGKPFAMQHENALIEPDFLTMAKGIAGGFPFAALAVSADVAKQINVGDHGGTYCGNPLGCAVALAVLRYLRAHNVAASVAEKGKWLGAALTELQQEFPQLIVQVRGRGLIWALQLADDDMVQRLTVASMASGLLVTPTRNGIVRILPSLLVSDDELELGVALLRKAFSRASVAVPSDNNTLDCGANELQIN